MAKQKYRYQKKRLRLPDYSKHAPYDVNQYEWGKMTEERAEKIIYLLLERGVIKDFRHASRIEDEEFRTDFIVTFNSGKSMGIQVKSSPKGAINFYLEEIYNPIEKRDYPVISFIPNIKHRDDNQEADRLWNKLKCFEEKAIYLSH